MGLAKLIPSYYPKTIKKTIPTTYFYQNIFFLTLYCTDKLNHTFKCG